MKHTYIQPEVLVAPIVLTVALLAGSAPSPDTHMDNGGGNDPGEAHAPLRLF